MTTTEFLSKLNVEQLRFARNEAQRLIDEIEMQQKVPLYFAVTESSSLIDLGYFYYYENALSYLIEQMKNLKGKPKTHYLKLDSIYVYESELKNFKIEDLL